MKQKGQKGTMNIEILRQIILAVEFLVKQGVPLRGYHDDKVDVTNEDINRGNFIAVLVKSNNIPGGKVREKTLNHARYGRYSM